MATDRHTAIRCTGHSPAEIQAKVLSVVAYYMQPDHVPSAMIAELSSTFSKIMWDHADEIATAYKQAMKVLR